MPLTEDPADAQPDDIFVGVIVDTHTNSDTHTYADDYDDKFDS